MKYIYFTILFLISSQIANLLLLLQLVFLDSINFSWAILIVFFLGGIITVISSILGIALGLLLNYFIKKYSHNEGLIKYKNILLSLNGIWLAYNLFLSFQFDAKHITLTLVGMTSVLMFTFCAIFADKVNE